VKGSAQYLNDIDQFVLLLCVDPVVNEEHPRTESTAIIFCQFRTLVGQQNNRQNFFDGRIVLTRRDYDGGVS
jgi:hypothetical protein